MGDACKRFNDLIAKSQSEVKPKPKVPPRDEEDEEDDEEGDEDFDLWKKAPKAGVDASQPPIWKGVKPKPGEEGLNEGFQFNNPNVSAECGCGESFTV